MKLAGALIFILSCLFASVANGQQYAITPDEYEKALDSAIEVSEKRIRRVTTLIETRTKGRITSKSHHVAEFIPPELERFVDTISSGDVSTTDEIIQIGRFGYQKKERAPWVEWTGSPHRGLTVRMLTSRICGAYSEEICSYTSEQALLEGQVLRMLSRKGENNMHGSLHESTKVWISRDGMLVRTELVETEGPSNEWMRKTTSTWEYDPAGFKIEPPIK